ncbi:hypothetical protein Taro_002642 [Colocasia esculenta]|uniref:Uncharacterized protein n=1 Tax=Colocasia esculenta TaxID=4460 RepID=A0A843TPC3_COLES|nr:hypothetical protein [Colocasia esculenta]
MVLAIGWNSRSSHWPCYAQVQRSDVIQGYNWLVHHVGIHGQRRLTEALNKDSLVRQKEYLTESLSKRRKCVLGYNRLVNHVGIHGQRRLTEALYKDSLVWQKEYLTESSSKPRKWSVDIGI